MQKILLIIIYLLLLSNFAFADVEGFSINLPEYTATDTIKTYTDSFYNLKNLTSGYVMLTFIMPSCPACDRLIDMISKIKQTCKDVSFVFITDKKYDELSELANKYLIIIDKDYQLAELLQVNMAPTSYFYQDGIFLTRKNWPIEEEVLETLIKDIVEGSFQLRNDIILSKTLPYFEGIILPNQQKINLDNLKKPCLVSFITTTCPACREVLPVVKNLSSETDLPVYLVIPESKESINKSGLFSDNNLYLISCDINQLRSSFNEKRIKIVFPITALLDENGEIIWFQFGYSSNYYNNSLKKAIQGML